MSGPGPSVFAAEHTAAPITPELTPAKLRAAVRVVRANLASGVWTREEADRQLRSKYGLTHQQLIEAAYPRSAPPGPVRSGDVALKYAHMIVPLADELAGGMAAAGSPGQVPVGDPRARYTAARDAYRAAEARLAAHPGANLATEGAGVAAAIPMLSKLLPQLSVVGNTALGATAGAVGGADAAPEMADVPRAAARGAVVGGATGLGLEGALGALNHFLSPAAANVAIRVAPGTVGARRGTAFARTLTDEAGIETPNAANRFISRFTQRNAKKPALSRDIPSSQFVANEASHVYAPLEAQTPAVTAEASQFLQDPRIARIWRRVAPTGGPSNFENWQSLRQELRRLSRTVGSSTDVQPISAERLGAMASQADQHMTQMWPGLPAADRANAQANGVKRAFRAGQQAVERPDPLLPHELQSAADAAAADAGAYRDQAREAFHHGVADAKLRLQLSRNRATVAPAPPPSALHGFRGHDPVSLVSSVVGSVLHPQPEAATVAMSRRLSDLFGIPGGGADLMRAVRPNPFVGSVTGSGVVGAVAPAIASAKTWEELWMEHLRSGAPIHE